MRVELLMSGDEILDGTTVDTNGPWLMARLHDLGFQTSWKTTVPDRVRDLERAIRSATARKTGLLIGCGGLGPTDDDVTREAAAEAAEVPLREHPDALKMLKRRIRRSKKATQRRDLLQARLPAGAAVLENENGTAPGFSLAIGGCMAFFLPGPPREFRPMVERHVLPWLTATTHEERRASMTLRTFGVGESSLAETLEGVRLDPGVRVGYQVVYPEVHLRLHAQAATRHEAQSRCEEAAKRIRAELGSLVFGENEETLPAVIGKILTTRGETLALAESCTGGLLGSLITDTPRSSKYFLGSIVTYSNEMKRQLLGVPAKVLERYGAVSRSCAAAMADGALERTGASHALSITGIAGPGGGTRSKPVGTVFLGFASVEAKTEVVRKCFRGDREMIRRTSAFAALDVLRTHLQGQSRNIRDTP